MDICSHIGLSVPDEANSLHGLCIDTLESTNGVTEDLSVHELRDDVSKFLNIHDDREEVVGSIPPYVNCKFQKEDASDEPHQREITTGVPEKCLGKCATFPCSKKTSSSAASSVAGPVEGGMEDGADVTTSELSTHDKNIKSQNPPCSRSLSLPPALKLVSAMKGSREKRGATPPYKLTVKWAPDVYDPIPTSVSHVVTNNKSQRHSKKNSKNKQKNGSKSSRGGKGKEKKQARKRGGNSSSMVFKLPEHEEEVVDFCEPQPSAMDFHVGNPDRFCGSSFLKRYGTSLHLSSVAEAT